MTNPLSENIRNGESQLGIVISFCVPSILEAIASDWDWLWLDNQHGNFNTDSLSSAVATCNLAKTPCLVRVSYLNQGEILKALDIGANGVIIPMIETPQQAQQAVSMAKFPPLGIRSFGSNLLIARQGFDYAENANRDTLLICQIETKLGLENLDEILAIDGVDGILFGFVDLAISMGKNPREAADLDYIKKILAQAKPINKKYNKIIGGFITSRNSVSIAQELGCQMIAVSTDIGMLKKQSVQTAEEFGKSTETKNSY